MKKIVIFFAIAIIAGMQLKAQNGIAVNTNGTQPNTSAMLDISSSSKGLLIPRMTAAQRSAIVNPATGLQVYQTDGTTGFYYFNGNAWLQLGGATGGSAGWSIAGNNAINPAINFIGTTDDQPLIGKANGEQVFRFSPSTTSTLLGYQAGKTDATGGDKNHFIGYQAGFLNTSYNNHFDGYRAGCLNTSGYSNQFCGYQAGYNNTTGNENLFIGCLAGYTNTEVSGGHFIGVGAGFSNTTGQNNHFSGYKAGLSNTIGSNNHFEGNHAGFSNTTGFSNHFTGFNSGYNNLMGAYNQFEGYEAGYHNISGDNNYFTGFSAGYSNISGSNNQFIGIYAGYSNTSGKHNQFIGLNAGASNQTGSYNEFLGDGAGYSNSTGSSNLVFGYKAGYSNSTGSNNIFQGIGSGYKNVNGNENTYIGQSAGHENISGNGNVALGNYAGYNETGSNKLYISNSPSNTPLIYGEFDNKLLKVAGSLEINGPNYDDGQTMRFTNRQYNGDWKLHTKEGPSLPGYPSFYELSLNTSQNTSGTPLFLLNGTGTLWITGAMYSSSDKRLKTNITRLNNALSNLLTLNGYSYNWIDSSKSRDQQIGLMAQEVEAVYPQLVSTDKHGYKSVAYSNMVPVLLQSIKEQQAMIDVLKAENVQFKKDMGLIKQKLGL